ncbi:hypothetical protein MZI55_17305 [Escherichia coli]|nr:hypothetical protein [Escherichia coli]
MMDNQNNFTLESLKFAASFNESAARLYRRITCNSYDKFIEMFYIDLEKTIRLIEKNASLMQNDGEDRLSIEIINILIGFGYDSGHDNYINGHSDIVVSFKNYTWIGEAKIHSSYDYLMEGFHQLCSRYSTGSEDDCQGGLIIYVKSNNALDVVEKWKKTLTSKKDDFEDFYLSDCKTREKLSFYSSHKHPKSGLPYKVRHFAVILGFAPKDKSARTAKSRK